MPPRTPIALVTRLASLVDDAIERYPEFASQYLIARENGEAIASDLLWSRLFHESDHVSLTWEELRKGMTSDRTAAGHALMLLVILDGWGRIKTCDVPECGSPYADATNGKTRLRCAAHARGHESRNEP